MPKENSKDDPKVIRKAEEYIRMVDDAELVVQPAANSLLLPNPPTSMDSSSTRWVAAFPNAIGGLGQSVLSTALIKAFAGYEKWKSYTDGSQTTAATRVIYWVDAGKLAGAIKEGDGVLGKLKAAKKEITSLNKKLATERGTTARLSAELRECNEQKSQYNRQLQKKGK